MIIFLYGQDNFRSHLKLNELKDKYFKEVDKLGSGLKVLAGAKATFAEITAAVGPSSLFSKRRLIVIEDLFANQDPEIFKKLLVYLKKSSQLASGNIVIFWESNIKMKKMKNIFLPFLLGASNKDEPLDKGQTELFKFLAEQKYSPRSFDLLSHVELANWAKKEVMARGGKISAKAVAVLVGLVGADGWQLHSEIDKLLSFKAAAKLTGLNAEISEEDVKNLVQGNFSDNIFSLTDAISVKNRALAVKLLDELIESGLDGHYLLSMFIRQFRILLRLRQAMDTGLSSRQTANLVKLHPFVLRKGLEQARNFSLTTLTNIFSQLVRIDYSVKSGRGDYLTSLNMLIARI
jgi:DNA polymerase III delta subunit